MARRSSDTVSEELMSNYLADERAKYQIRVQGRLAAQWAARLGDMTVAVHDGEGQPAVTDLTGWIADQAALMGVLEQLYALRVTVVSVERLKEDPGSQGTQT
jgi:hypothetical protein